ncbi:MAG: DUF1587 domain-containing protein [Pirellulaceae bacterium]
MIIRSTVFVVVSLLPLVGRAADDVYTTTIRPLLDRHCVECHGGGSPKEGLNLEEKKPGESIAALQDIQLLDAIAERLRSHAMPPPESDRPLSEADLSKLLDWVNGQIDCSLGGESNPGRVTIRRLTKVNYHNTIRDLLGLDVDTGQFPSDDVAHGFDNLAFSNSDKRCRTATSWLISKVRLGDARLDSLFTDVQNTPGRLNQLVR